MTYNPGPQRNVTKLNGATRISSHHLCCEWRSDNQGDAFTGFGAVASRWNASLHAALSWGRTLEECIDGCQTLPGCTFASHEHAHGTCVAQPTYDGAPSATRTTRAGSSARRIRLNCTLRVGRSTAS